MTTHPDTMKMRRSEMETCGCDRCQEGLRLSALLDKLVESANRRDEALARLAATVDSLETTLKSL